MNKFIVIILGIIIVAGLLPLPVFAQGEEPQTVWFVSSRSGATNNDGTTATEAMLTIQQAIDDSVGEAGDLTCYIYVDVGDYEESLTMVPNRHLFGGIDFDGIDSYRDAEGNLPTDKSDKVWNPKSVSIPAGEVWGGVPARCLRSTNNNNDSKARAEGM